MILSKLIFNSLLTFSLFYAVCGHGYARDEAKPGKKPNIVYILADDLGYGDVHYLNPEHSRLPTPNWDRLCEESLIFTDAHSGSAVCTPTRYGILTGRYAWRTRLQKSVLFPKDKPLIAPGVLTVPELLKKHGYKTACIGKWHLGLEWQGGQEDYASPIINGPLNHGFDSYFGIRVPNFPPYCFIENDRTIGGELTARKEKWDLNGAPGPMLPDWRPDQILPTLTEKAVDYIEQRKGDDQPFFLFFTLTSPHEPVAPSPRFKGKSGISDIGDFVMETDWATGQVLDALERCGLKENTLVIFTADNGHATYTDVESLLDNGHKPSGPFRGYKGSIFEGGHRVPFMVRWPGKVQANSRTMQTICLTDLMATCADILGVELPADAAEDSVSLLPAFLGKTDLPLREAVVHHSVLGDFAIRKGKWKLIFCPGSGTNRQHPGNTKARRMGLPELQLYDISSDVAETRNVVSKYPEVVEELTLLMEKYIREGRSTPGPKQPNDVEVEFPSAL